jgi:hypothetical protein
MLIPIPLLGVLLYPPEEGAVVLGMETDVGQDLPNKGQDPGIVGVGLQIGQQSTQELKVPKCEIFDLFDFNDFYVIKSLFLFLMWARYVPYAYASNDFHFELAPKKKLFQIPLRSI